MNKLKILISAYACEPFLGSEPEVGFKWANNLHEIGHDVYVLTRKTNKNLIDKFYEKKSSKPKYIYIDLPDFFLKIIKRKSKYSYTYFFLWQYYIFFKYLIYLRKYKFDLIHHVTFVSLRFPPIIGLLGKRFIYGPVGGGELVPIKLLNLLDKKERLKEKLRNFLNHFIKFSPLNFFLFLKSDKIYVTSHETKKLVPIFFYNKTYIKSAITIDNCFAKKIIKITEFDPIRFLFVGRAESLKGIEIIFNTLKKITEKKFRFKLTMICNGKVIDNLYKLLNKYHLNHNDLEIINYLPRSSIINYYDSSHFLFFPSLRESGGKVILESLQRYKPVISLDINGQAQILNKNISILVYPTNKDLNEICEEFSNKIIFNINNPKKYNELVNNIKNYIYIYDWINLYRDIYREYLI